MFDRPYMIRAVKVMWIKIRITYLLFEKVFSSGLIDTRILSALKRCLFYRTNKIRLVIHNH